MRRRDFVSGISTALLLGAARARAARPVPRRERHSAYFDGLGVLDGLEKDTHGIVRPLPKLVRAVQAGHLDLMSMTIDPVGNGPNRFSETVQRLAKVEGVLATYPDLFYRVRRRSDLAKAGSNGKLGVIFNLQDTVALEADADRVAIFRSLGIGVIQLTYNKRNLSGDGCLEKANGGLSDFGREVIARINQEGVVLDLSHGGQKTVAEAISASRSPVLISHTGCRDVVDFPRSTYDRELRAVAETGGAIGIYLMPFLRGGGQPDENDLIRHLAHAVNVCGEDHVAIGTDNPFLGYAVDDRAREEHRAFYAQRAARGVAAPGEAPDVMNFVAGYNDSDRFGRLAADLRKRKWSDDRIDKVLGGNLIRVLGSVWRDPSVLPAES